MNDHPTPYAELAAVIGNLPLLLREARRARGLSLRAAAKQIGCSFATVSRIESGQDGAVSNTLAVMRWLDQTADHRAHPPADAPIAPASPHDTRRTP